MIRTYIRVYEAFITILSSFLAVSSFFSTSLYRVISETLVETLKNFRILTTSTQSITAYAPIMLSTLVFLVVIYDYAAGKPENMIDIYEINLVLITPELLGFSKLNWLNLVEKTQIVEPTRGPSVVFFTGVIVLIGYVSLLFTARARETYSELEARGVVPSQLGDIFMRQNQASIVLALSSAAVCAVVFYVLPPLKSVLAPIVSGLSYSYLILGAVAVAAISLGVGIYFIEQGEKQEAIKNEP
jgi:hypothetical protein